jgi:carbamoyltransferase
MIGVNVGHHDSSICHFLLEEGKIQKLEIILSERVCRKKNVGGFPVAALRFLQKTNPKVWHSIRDKDVVQNCFGDRPRLIEEKLATSLNDFTTLLEGFRLNQASSLYNKEIGFTPHHLSHACSVLPVMPFSQALIVVSDGAGSERRAFSDKDAEWDLVRTHSEGREYFSVYEFDNGVLKPLEKDFTVQSFETERQLRYSKSYGSHFECAAKLIFNNWQQAGKVMGLSAFGAAKKISGIREYLASLDIEKFKNFKSKLEFDAQSKESFQRAADVAATIQAFFNEQMLDHMSSLKLKYPDFENVVLVGGCALNGLFNMRLVESKLFKHVYVPPFPNDEGIALGCALNVAASRGEYKFETTPIEEIHPYYGPICNAVELHEERVAQVFSDFTVERSENIVEVAAGLIEKNEIVAWMQGRSEVGPRALGHRSILCRPDIPDIKNHLNNFVKYREKFRPYGGSVLKELAPEYFEVEESFHSPFMTFCAQVRPGYREKLAGVTHVDGTCRLQTLCEKQNPLYYRLIKKCYESYGLGVVLNTSLNLMDQPIVETLEDAKLFFEKSKIKYIIIGSYLIRKTDEISIDG